MSCSKSCVMVFTHFDLGFLKDGALLESLAATRGSRHPCMADRGC